MSFCDLHLHSTYSFLDAFGTPAQIVDRAKELNRKAIALTDHGMVSGLVKLNKSCIKAGIKPIFGCEFYTVPKAEVKETSDRHHLTILAKNQEGYENLMHLVTESWRVGFYYKPRIDAQMLFHYHKGLIVMSGCYSGSLCHAFREDKKKNAKKIVESFRKIFKEDYYLEMQPLELTYEYNLFLNDLAKETGIPLVMTNDVHYVRKGQDKLQKILHLIRGTDEDKLTKIDTQYQLDDKEMTKLFEQFPGIDWEQSINNTSKIADKINVEIPKSPMVRYPEGQDANKLLRQRCYDSIVWNKYKNDDAYKKRLEYELDIIVQKDFSSYFILISDVCNFMRSENILYGPGRGSAGGSLVCYILNITRMDPIKYDLMFERFLDLNRTDYPDIDIDIQPSRIGEVKAFVKRTFGDDNVASIATYAEYRGKNILEDLGRIYKIPRKDIDLFKDRIIQYSDADARYSFGIEDTIKKFPEVQRVIEQYPQLNVAMEIEGQFRHMGKHAAGTVVSGHPLFKSSAIYNREGEDLVCWDLKDFEDLNLLKIDLLKLETLEVLKKILDLIGWSIEDMYKLPLDDPKVLRAFKELDMLGIFQFDGYSAYWVLSQVGINTLDDLAHVNALGRPGPIFSRAAHRYIKGQKGIYEEEAIPELEPYVRNTGGEIIYQEQVMSIVRGIAGFSWEDASKIRKIIAKSLGTEGFNKFGKQFEEGCVKNGINSETAKRIWTRMATFGSWAFNRSHAFVYAALGYYTMYFKYYYPREFYFAAILSEEDPEKLQRLLLKFSDYGKIYLPNINKSDITWKLEGDKLYAGLTYLKGIGDKTAVEIVKNAPYKDWDELTIKIPRRVVRKNIIEILKNNNCLEEHELVSKAFEIFKKYNDRMRIKDIGWETIKTDRLVKLVCYMRKRTLYNQKQEDEIRGIKKDYGDKPLDFMVVNLEDETGLIKAKVPAWKFGQYRDLCMNTPLDTLFKIEGKQPFEQRTIWIQKIEKIEE